MANYSMLQRFGLTLTDGRDLYLTLKKAGAAKHTGTDKAALDLLTRLFPMCTIRRAAQKVLPQGVELAYFIDNVTFDKIQGVFNKEEIPFIRPERLNRTKHSDELYYGQHTEHMQKPRSCFSALTRLGISVDDGRSLYWTLTRAEAKRTQETVSTALELVERLFPDGVVMSVSPDRALTSTFTRYRVDKVTYDCLQEIFLLDKVPLFESDDFVELPVPNSYALPETTEVKSTWTIGPEDLREHKTLEEVLSGLSNKKFFYLTRVIGHLYPTSCKKLWVEALRFCVKRKIIRKKFLTKSKRNKLWSTSNRETMYLNLLTKKTSARTDFMYETLNKAVADLDTLRG